MHPEQKINKPSFFERCASEWRFVEEARQCCRFLTWAGNQLSARRSDAHSVVMQGALLPEGSWDAGKEEETVNAIRNTYFLDENAVSKMSKQMGERLHRMRQEEKKRRLAQKEQQQQLASGEDASSKRHRAA